MMKPSCRAAIVACCLLILSAGRAMADTTIPTDLPDMSARADVIFSGVCDKVTEETKGAFKVLTYTFTVQEVVKGNLTVGKPFTFSMWPDRGSPGYAVGREYVLFLLPETSKGLRGTVGNMYGRFTVTRQQDGTAKVMSAGGNRNLFPASAASAKVMKAMSIGGTQPGDRKPVDYKAFIEMVNVLKDAN